MKHSELKKNTPLAPNPSDIIFTSVSVIIPVLNEVTSLVLTVDTILNSSGKHIHEIILVVCEKTTEESLSTCRMLMSRYDGKITIHRQQLPRLGGALREGIHLAQGSHVLIMYSDAESDPNSVEPLIREAQKHPDAIISASRWLEGSSFINYPPIKRFLNYAFQFLFSFVYGNKVTDFTFGYRLYPLIKIRDIKFEEVGHSFVFESILKSLRASIPIIEIPTRWTARTEGTSQTSFMFYLRYLWVGLKIRFAPASTFLNTEKPYSFVDISTQENE